MSQFDIMFWKIILVGGGIILLFGWLFLLAYEATTGIRVGFPAWARILGVVAALAVIVSALAVKGEK